MKKPKIIPELTDAEVRAKIVDMASDLLRFIEDEQSITRFELRFLRAFIKDVPVVPKEQLAELAWHD